MAASWPSLHLKSFVYNPQSVEKNKQAYYFRNIFCPLWAAVESGMSDKCVCSVQKFKNGQGKWTLLGFIFSQIIKILKY